MTIEAPYGDLYDYRTGEYVRPATADEAAESIEAAEHDGGRGTFEADDGRVAYVVTVGSAYEAALDYLDAISDEQWSRVVGDQTRDAFARLAIDSGDDVGSEWIRAVDHAETL